MPEATERKRLFVLDTNVLMHDPSALFRFEEHDIFIPMVVLEEQECLRPRDRFWDTPVPKIDSAFDDLFVPQPSWSPSTTQQLRKLVADPYLAPI